MKNTNMLIEHTDDGRSLRVRNRIKNLRDFFRAMDRNLNGMCREDGIFSQSWKIIIPTSYKRQQTGDTWQRYQTGATRGRWNLSIDIPWRRQILHSTTSRSTRSWSPNHQTTIDVGRLQWKIPCEQFHDTLRDRPVPCWVEKRFGYQSTHQPLGRWWHPNSPWLQPQSHRWESDPIWEWETECGRNPMYRLVKV